MGKRKQIDLMITQEQLHKILNYDYNSGIFTWNETRSGTKAKIGDEAGTNSCGYRRIQIDGHRYMASVLAWLYVMGKFPEYEIDHIDGNTLNNSWKNLREATGSQNCFNKKITKLNKSGYKGVSLHSSGRWQGNIKSKRKTYYIGLFDSPEEASKAVEQKRKELHGSFARS